ncbi:MAG: D-alanine--D-alanine ligase [Alphaproteobacteria bacterium]|nr:D-alanine--D-alanine ligase [Alphaproteobacteria bacterium]
MAKKIAVFFGGQSFEHDVSILTGLQVCQVMDRSRYQPIPVYVDRKGHLWIGKELSYTINYPIDDYMRSKLSRVSLEIGNCGSLAVTGGIFKRRIKFDAAFLAFHGGSGESGAWQGALAAAKITYAGASVLASSVYMSKHITKLLCRQSGINVLPETIVRRPETIDIAKITAGLDIKYPVIVKPESLGSSVGVSRANNKGELSAALLAVFKMDTAAIIEPFVENLVEYNIAVMKKDGAIVTSTIETPNSGGEVWSFAGKYMGDGAKKKKTGFLDAMPSDEVLASRREYAPKITAKQENFIRSSAVKLFDLLGANGAPRIDYLCNSKTGEIWLNEVNPIPGAFAFYLWRNSMHAVSYQDLVSILLDNAFNEESVQAFDLNASGSKIFK